MTWIDNNGEVRPQSWEEYCELQAGSRCLPFWMSPRFNYFPLRPQSRDDEKIPRMRIRLFRADPHCFWCGRRVELNGGHGSPEYATVDHLYSRLHPQRLDRHRKQSGVLHVLACHACNNERGLCEQRQKQFVPKLRERLQFAQLADATLAIQQQRKEQQAAVRQRRKKEQESRIMATPLPVKQVAMETPRPPMRIIQTLKEAIEYARENPAR